MQPNFDHIMRRTQRYWYDDGIAEIAAGILLVVGGILLYLAYMAFLHWYPVLRESPWTLALAIGVIVLAQLLAFVPIKRWIEAIKQRITYPRTGYVAYRQPAKKPITVSRVLMAFIWAVIGGGVLGFVFGRLIGAGFPEEFLSLPASMGLSAAVLLGLLAQRMDLTRFWWLAGFALLLILPVAWLDTAFLGGMAYLVAVGLMLIGSGGWTLRQYLHQNPTPADEEV
jgi:MFS family permease